MDSEEVGKSPDFSVPLPSQSLQKRRQFTLESKFCNSAKSAVEFLEIGAYNLNHAFLSLAT